MLKRRIITEDVNGVAVVREVTDLKPVPMGALTGINVWLSQPGAQVPEVAPVPSEVPTTLLEPGQVIVFNVTFPPNQTALDAGDSVPIHHDGGKPGFHATNTIDIQTCIEGEMVLELDEGEVVLKTGDTAVLHGQSHRWRNDGDVPATLYITLIGAERA